MLLIACSYIQDLKDDIERLRSRDGEKNEEFQGTLNDMKRLIYNIERDVDANTLRIERLEHVIESMQKRELPELPEDTEESSRKRKRRSHFRNPGDYLALGIDEGATCGMYVLSVPRVDFHTKPH